MQDVCWAVCIMLWIPSNVGKVRSSPLLFFPSNLCGALRGGLRRLLRPPIIFRLYGLYRSRSRPTPTCICHFESSILAVLLLAHETRPRLPATVYQSPHLPAINPHLDRQPHRLEPPILIQHKEGSGVGALILPLHLPYRPRHLVSPSVTTRTRLRPRFPPLDFYGFPVCSARVCGDYSRAVHPCRSRRRPWPRPAPQFHL
ncbi:hypothetical protein FB45DRAFT_885862 [Roridomyces roridus]|uniref:Secreted protein n=1 Tax=Roridomyces roridus TaxID=1738132 RepID=A0AAD7CKB5_9AGAR|nr:hypothetical protein FB45DRAFT_885862 [Roridomyces roridus]